MKITDNLFVELAPFESASNWPFLTPADKTRSLSQSLTNLDYNRCYLQVLFN